MRNFANELHQQRKTSKHSSRRGTDGEHGAAVAHGRDPRMVSLGETLDQVEEERDSQLKEQTAVGNRM